MPLVKASELEDVRAIPTGLFVDRLTGVGGVPRGHITEIFGDAGIGKSSLCLQIVAAAQKAGARCLWVDAEWAYTPRYASDLGVRNGDLSLVREEYAEAALDLVLGQLEARKADLVVIDSIGGLHTRAEAEKDIEGATIGAQAKLVAKFCRKAVPLLAMNKVALVVINHSVVDIMSGKITTSGGKKLSYHKALSIRLKPKQGMVLKVGDRQVGKVVVAQVWGKNRLAATEGLALDAQIIFGRGFSAAADLFEEAIGKGVIVKKGNKWQFRGETLGIGKVKAREALEASEELQARVKEAL